VFTGARGGKRNFGVCNIGSANVDDINQRRLNDFLPIGGGLLPAELAASGLDTGTVASADGMHFDFGLEGEEVRSLAPRIGMGLSHEPITDHSDS